MKQPDRPAGPQPPKSYVIPITSPLLLTCGKCQRRLKGKGDPEGLLPFKKLLKRIARRQGTRPPTLLKVPCLKLCPGNGLVVITPAQLAGHRCSILSTRDDVQALHGQLYSDLTAESARRG